MTGDTDRATENHAVAASRLSLLRRIAFLRSEESAGGASFGGFRRNVGVMQRLPQSL